MCRTLLLCLTMLVFFCNIDLLAAEKLRCKICSKRINGRYIKGSDGNSYCGKKCFSKSLPRCKNCKKVCQGRVLKVKNVFYCSKECAEKSLLPACGRCSQSMKKWMILPTPYGKFNYCYTCWKLEKCLLCMRPVKNLIKLPNGNLICRYCNKDIVKNLAELQQIFNQVRKDLAKKFNFPDNHPIKLEMRSFAKGENWDTSREFGLYKYRGRIIFTAPSVIGKMRKQKTTYRFENESCNIIIMDYLPRHKAAEVIAHELAHDYMKHRWYFIKSDLLKEGFAELIAAEYNRYCGNERWNYRMEVNPDKVYGDGYRLMKNYLQKGSWQEVYRQLDIANKQDLPPELKNK